MLPDVFPGPMEYVLLAGLLWHVALIALVYFRWDYMIEHVNTTPEERILEDE